jgi:hypothetical protein
MERESDSKSFLKISARVSIELRGQAKAQSVFIADEKAVARAAHSTSADRKALIRVTISVYNNLQGVGSKDK